MSATNHTNDYFRSFDLNPPTATGPGPVTDPRDPRGQCWFGFISSGQRVAITFGTTPPPTGVRVLYSFDYEYFSGVGITPPPPAGVKPHGVLSLGGPADQEQTYIEGHDRSFVALWLDPTGVLPPAGQPVQVSVKAWRQD